MKNTRVFAVCLATLAITACSTNNVGLAYKPSATIVAGDSNAPKVSVGSFIDQRGESATWLGAVRGGYGNPLKTLEATPSVSALVQTAFSDGVRARGLQTSAGLYQISGVIKKLDCSQYARREAHAVIEVDVFEASSGKKVFTQTYSADELEGSLLALNVGAFGSVESLRALAEKALNEVVDKALDDTALRHAMRQPGA